MANPKKTPLVLCILDGWGHTKTTQHNAIFAAKTPTWDRWTKTYPEILLDASGPSVGLPQNQMGNSEVGHTTLGTGRVVLQDLPRIHAAIQRNELEDNTSLKACFKKLKDTNKTCHIMGLFSEGGVHSHQEHYVALATLAAKAGISVKLHLFLDGRDTPPKSAVAEMKALDGLLKKYSNVSIASIMGRFYAMDRDKRWDRTDAAYHAMVCGDALHFDTPQKTIEACYKDDKTDEFIPPHVAMDYAGMEDGDAFIMVNFRADRVRQILHAFTDKKSTDFKRKKTVSFSKCVSMKEYSEALAPRLDVLFPPVKTPKTLGEILSKEKIRQLRIAETEKYAHVTFFFNGGLEDEFEGEERILVPSPKVKTYDLKPEMSAAAITDHVVKALKADKFDVVIMNYANTDMVGHTGKMKPTIKAVETVDHALAQLEKIILEKNGTLLVTADHGNAETMKNPKTHQAHTAHTTNPVPFFCVTQQKYDVLHETGGLKDVSPTILSLLGIDVPKEMTGKPLIK